MKYKCQDILKNESFNKLELLNEAGYTAKVVLYRDYLAKIKIEKDGKPIGKVNMYYSPKKDSIKCVYNELEKCEVELKNILDTNARTAICRKTEPNFNKREKYLHEEKLKAKAKSTISKINCFKKNDMKLDISLFRDYLVKIKIKCKDDDIGHLNIYYSTKKKRYTYKFNEIKNENVAEKIKNIIYSDFKEKKKGKKKEKAKLKTTKNKIIKYKKPIEEIMIDKIAKCNPNKIYNVYVDGSYYHNRKLAGYGIVILENKDVKCKIKGKIIEKSILKSANITSEIYGVVQAVKYCQRKGIEKINLHHDLDVLESWAKKNLCDINLQLAKYYNIFLNISNVKIKWIKVKAHSGDEYNNMADRLAKKGAKTKGLNSSKM